MKFLQWFGYKFPTHDDAEGDAHHQGFLRGYFRPPVDALVVERSIHLPIDDRVTSLLNAVDVHGLEMTLGYTFKEKTFLLEAITHCSFSNNKITNSYERLEFLGMLDEV